MLDCEIIYIYIYSIENLFCQTLFQVLLNFVGCNFIETNFMASIIGCTIQDFMVVWGGEEALSMESVAGIGICQILLLKCKRDMLALY